MTSCMGVGTSFAIFMSPGPRRRQMEHTLSWAIENSVIKRLLRKVWAGFKESKRDGAASRGISRKPWPAEA